MADGLFRRRRFAAFGPCGLTGEEAELQAVRGRGAARLRLGVRTEVPRLPGVYGLVDATGELVYVGKAKSLRARLLSYFRPGSREQKSGKLIKEARKIVWEVRLSEFAALLRELELIRRWQPRFNVQGQPKRRRRVFLCLGRRPAPHAFVTARPPSTAVAAFGPLAGAGRAREAARWLNDGYRLRDCPQAQEMVFADQQELFPVLNTPGCLRHEIGTCLGPCAARCTQDAYATQLRAVTAFLEGRDEGPLPGLERDMTAAAAALAFERAAVLRDRLATLTWLRNQLARVREAARRSVVYPVAGHDGREAWYLIWRGRVRGVFPAPACAASRARVAGEVAALYQPGTLSVPPGVDEVDGVLLVDGWLRRHGGERARLRAPADVLAECRAADAKAPESRVDS